MEEIENHKADREELNQLINDYEETMEEFNNEVKNIMQSQSSVQQSTSQTLNYHGINIVEPLVVYSDIQAIKTFWSGMVEADSIAKGSFSDAQLDVQQLEKKMITFLEAIGKDGGKVGSLDVDKLRSAIFEDKGMLDTIEKKLTNGESLSSAERDLLYQYLQSGLFSEEDHKKMQEISEVMENSPDDFKEYINEEVLATEKHLEEIMFLELYLFKGDQRPDELTGTEEDRIKWENYLQVLKNVHMDINKVKEFHNWERSKDDPLYAHLDFIETEFSRNPVSGHTQSEIRIMFFPDNFDELLSKDELFSLDDRNFQIYNMETQKSISDVEYFYRTKGTIDYKQRGLMNIKDEMNTYTGEFIAAEIFSLAVSLLPGDKVIDILLTSGDYVQGNKENEQKQSLEIIEQTAIAFDLQLQVNNHRAGSNLEIRLIPSQESFDILDRWETVHQVDSSIPYPEIEIEDQDWIALNRLMLGELDEEEGGHGASITYDFDNEIYEYIIRGKESNNPTVQLAVDRKKH